VLADLFERLAQRDADAPEPALSVEDAAESLLRWWRGGGGSVAD
jgi:hypothetical protein